MPLLVVCAIIVLARVLTLPAHPDHPDQTVLNGLGYMWNPSNPNMSLLQGLSRSEVWLAATGQIFFSLSVGFGLILTYASYLKPDDDVALSSLTAAAGNGFCELVLGGMIAIPAAFVFLGPTVIQNPPGTFGMGFVTLPHVFNLMPGGRFFGFLFFFLLFIAAVTSSLSMLQPTIALLEEGLKIGRKPSVAIVGAVTLAGSLFVVYFSKGFTALDTIDFWMANFFIFILATIQVLFFGWYMGIDKGMDELRRGAEMRLPPVLGFVLKYISPVFLLGVFGIWCWQNLPDRLHALTTLPEGEPPVVLMSVGLILIVAVFFVLITASANRVWDKEEGRT
jgi:NSS family neurotransmitter:Na+ symporter